MADVLDIVQAGDPVLRQTARALALDELAERAALIAQMRDTMRAAPGVGLAAPQIGRSEQLVVIEDSPALQANLTPAQLAARERSAVPFHVLVNPQLTVLDPTPVEAFEGCLSFAGFVMVVPRARRVRVEALDEHGQRVAIEAGGWYARILQHEIDHLHGTLCCDRMYARTLTSVELFARHWREHTIADVLAALAVTPRAG